MKRLSEKHSSRVDAGTGRAAGRAVMETGVGIGLGMGILRFAAMRWAGVIAVVGFAVMVSGCGLEGGEDDGFGKIRSDSGYGTVDGISGFVHLLKQRGKSVRTSTRISPLIERYDTILWAPDREMPPSEAAITRLEQWVNDGYGERVLIFIGPGFRGRQWLDKKQIEIASGDDLEKTVRRYNEKLIRRQYWGGNYWNQADGEECRWYELTSISDRPIQTLSGRWSEGVADVETELYSGTYEFSIPANLKSLPPKTPPSAPSNQRPLAEAMPSDASVGDGWSGGGPRPAEVLLTGDGQTLVYRIPAEVRAEYQWSDEYADEFGEEYEEDYGEEPGGEYTDQFGDQYGGVAYADDEADVSGIYILANGSFVQNFGLVSPGNQMLANRVANLCGRDVLVLQSGPSAIDVTNSLAPEKNGWAWLRQRPLREIVPFFLLLATVTFFVAFPIHGRPRRIQLRPEKTFADHVRATGRLLKSTKGKQWAQAAIKKYQDRSSDKNSG